jgi:CDP-glycerol glycerophosphotransferase (TagB/SpsB family)
MLAARTAALPDVALVIRPHPNEWRPLVQLMNRGVHVSTALTARQALRAADVLVTHSSFMAVEAALVDRPVILVSPEPVPSLLPLITEGLARWVCTSADLQRGLQDLLDNDDGAARARFREEQAGLAGLERATDVIADLARHPS